MSYITSIGTAVPKNRFHQTELSSFMTKAMQLNYENGRKLSAIFRSSGITTRHSVLDDYGRDKDFTFYPNTNDFEPFPSTEQRLNAYQTHALSLGIQAVHDCVSSLKDFDTNSITHLIVVSCTGMYAPGLDIDLVKHLKLRTDVQRVGINFMGCYAAINAIKTADAFCKAYDAHVLIVCVELCSLHFQKHATEDNILANALFADGAAAVIMQSNPAPGINLAPEAFHNAIAFSDDPQMAWRIGNVGFEMKLTSYVPEIIKSGIKKLTDEMLEKIKISFKDISHFAIHPGGKKILDVIEQELGISKENNENAYSVLNNYGNMSSPTVLFVLKQTLKNLTRANEHEHILSFAFGPGLTLESILFKIQYA